MTDHLVKLKTVSTCSNLLKNLIPDLHFRLVFGDQDVASLNSEPFKDEKINSLIKHFKIEEARKISIFRYMPNTSYYWHTDGIRCAAINMLISGYDSMTLFGKNPVNFT